MLHISTLQPASLQWRHDRRLVCTAGNVAKWGEYTTGRHVHVEIPGGDHYFVSRHYQEVVKVLACRQKLRNESSRAEVRI